MSKTYFRLARSAQSSVPESALSACAGRFLRKPRLLLAFLMVLFCFPGFPGPAEGGTRVQLTPEERTWIDQNPEKLILLFNTEFPPIEFADVSGKFTGMGADVVTLVEQRLGVTFRKLAAPDWNKHLAALESGACAIAPTIVATAERERYAFFTAPYATVPVVIITCKAVKGDLTLEDLAGRRVAVVSGYATEKFARDSARGRFEVVPVSSVPEGLRGVAFGRLDALLENLAVAAYYIDQEGIPNLRVAGDTPYVFAWSIGVSRKFPLLYSAIQKALGAVTPDELESEKTSN